VFPFRIDLSDQLGQGLAAAMRDVSHRQRLSRGEGNYLLDRLRCLLGDPLAQPKHALGAGQISTPWAKLRFHRRGRGPEQIL
jgi:hypothetical protein